MSRKLGDTGSKELPQRCHFNLGLSFSLNNRACQQLAKLLLLWRREEKVKVIRWGFCSGAQALHGKDNAFSTLERGDRAFVPFSFPWFQYLLTIRNILSRAIVSNGDRDTLPHASSPAAGWRALVDTYSASTLGAKVQFLQSLTSRRVKPGANPIPIFAAMVEDVRNMRANGSGIGDVVVCLLFLRALPDEYNVLRQMLEREREELTTDRLRTELRARYELLIKGKSSKTFDTAFLASGTKRGNSRRRREKSPQLLPWSFRETRRSIFLLLVQQDSMTVGFSPTLYC